jgi:hypothetical protein
MPNNNPMEGFMKMLIVSFLMFSATAMAGATNSNSIYDGAGDAGGGDAYSLEFSLLGHQAVETVRSAKIEEINTEDFSSAVLNSRVVSEDKLYLNGEEVDAINYPSQKKIEMSRTRWDQLEGNRDRKLKLVIHEYLSVMGLSDANYALTEKVISSQGEPVLSVLCRTAGGGKPIWYGINLYKDAQPEIVRSLSPKEVSAGVTKITLKGLSTMHINGAPVTKSKEILVTFIDASFTTSFDASLSNMMIPLKFKKIYGDELEQKTELQIVKKKSNNSSDYKLISKSLDCARFDK